MLYRIKTIFVPIFLKASTNPRMDWAASHKRVLQFVDFAYKVHNNSFNSLLDYNWRRFKLVWFSEFEEIKIVVA